MAAEQPGCHLQKVKINNISNHTEELTSDELGVKM